MLKISLNKILSELWTFGLKQANAAIFGGILLFVIIITKYISIGFMHRYDLIFLVAILTQCILIIFKYEHKQEIYMIVCFHILATAMELFKTSPQIQSWQYPETAVFMIATVPLFTGFLYSAVGSYIARVWRIFNFSFSSYPKYYLTIILALVSYLNFITHHFTIDIRNFLFVFSLIIFWKTKVHFTIIKTRRSMSLVIGFLLVSLFIWFAENIGTFARVWIYPNQHENWELVSFSKLGSWYLLMIVSFVLVSTIYRTTLNPKKI